MRQPGCTFDREEEEEEAACLEVATTYVGRDSWMF